MQLGVLHALARDQYCLRSDTALAGLSEGIPYPLQDAGPAGFLGRTVLQRYPELDLPLRVNDWSDEHFLRLALAFWDQLTTAMRLSPQFRQIAMACRQAVSDSP